MSFKSLRFTSNFHLPELAKKITHGAYVNNSHLIKMLKCSKLRHRLNRGLKQSHKPGPTILRSLPGSVKHAKTHQKCLNKILPLLNSKNENFY